jgi:hypothetical protein
VLSYILVALVLIAEACLLLLLLLLLLLCRQLSEYYPKSGEVRKNRRRDLRLGMLVQLSSMKASSSVLLISNMVLLAAVQPAVGHL